MRDAESCITSGAYILAHILDGLKTTFQSLHAQLSKVRIEVSGCESEDFRDPQTIPVQDPRGEFPLFVQVVNEYPRVLFADNDPSALYVLHGLLLLAPQLPQDAVGHPLRCVHQSRFACGEG
jgi:hypothetical protein